MSLAQEIKLLTYTTEYTYDILGNLTQVNQGGQKRYFLYDSLSRLRAAKNPEQGTLTPAGEFANWPTNAAGGWSMAYLYDAVGNLTKRRDARNIETSYQYDNLNRNTVTTYSAGVTPAVTRYYDGWRNNVPELTANAVGQLWRTETANTALVTYRNFDALGRPLTLDQQFAFQNGSQWAWTTPYRTTRSFDLGLPTGQTYPSQHSVTYSYDTAGRLKGFTGNLGDGVPRAYADTTRFNERGVQSERFGTLTELYHKQQYNVRGQLWDVQLGTTAALNDAPNSWNRGRLQNLYTANTTAGNTAPASLSASQTTSSDNNGNLRQQNILLPEGTYWQQQYTYDPLNRLQKAEERRDGSSTLLWRQEYEYDRWGNRTLSQTQTTGDGIPKPSLAVDTATNRLQVPTGVAGNLSYDGAGNLTFDNYTGSGERVFDAENRLTGAYVGPASNQTAQGRYTYDGDGRRISRTAGGTTTWQVYGFGGELLAEYAAYGATFVPTQEYGYQGGKMLITVRNGNAQRLHKFIENLYLRTGQSFTANEVQVRVNALAAAGYTSENDLLTEARTQARLLLSQYQTTNPTATAFVQALYLSVLQRYGTSGANSEVAWWASQAQGNPDGVREAFLSSGEFMDRIHNLYGSDQTDTQRTDAFAEHLYQSILGRELDASAQAWLRNSLDTASAKDLPTTISKAQEWAQTLFNSPEYLNRGRDQQGFVYDLYLTYLGHEPDAQGWQYWSGQVGPQWANKQAVLNAFAGAGPYGEKASTLYREIFWLVSDHLGTPRLIAERTGSAAGLKRHDYLPFGEEIGVGVGGRADGHGYQTLATHDTARQQFTGYERDDETGLDFAQARYYSSSMGRFISVDPLMASADIVNPQTLNRYTYVGNNPVNLTDPTGTIWASNGSIIRWFDGDLSKGFSPITSFIGQVNGSLIALNPSANSYVPVVDAAQAIRQLATWGASATALAASGATLGLTAVAVAAIAVGPYSADALGKDSVCLADAAGCNTQQAWRYLNEAIDDLENNAIPPQAISGGEVNSPSGPDPENNKPTTPKADKRLNGFGKPDVPIEKQLAGKGQLAALRSNPNLRGVDVNNALNKTPRQLVEEVKAGNISERAFKAIKKAFEGRQFSRK